MGKLKQIMKNKTFLAFLLSFVLGSIIVIPNIIINNGIFSLTADFNTQQIPFNKIINYSIKNGSIFWTWFNDLGSNFIGTFSFYNLLSPFSIIGYLFPDNIYQYLAGPLCILKYSISGLTSYLFLKRYVKNKNYALIGSLLYSFSGYQLTTLLFHFHDVIALFPLLLYSLDNLMYDNKKYGFCISIIIMALTNWFLFVGECIFLIIYFLVKVFCKEYKITKQKIICLIIETIVALLFSSIILIPTALFMKSNPRVGSSWTILSMIKYPSIAYYLEIFKSFLFPNEVMYPHASIVPANYYSVEIYLPVVGIVLAMSYFVKNKKNWLSILMFILCIFMIVPVLNSSFLLFQSDYYARWFYMPTLILSLMSIKCLDENLNKRPGFIISIVCLMLFFTVFIIYNKKSIYGTGVFEPSVFVLSIIVTIINLILTYKNKSFKLLLIYIFVFVSLWGNITVYYYKDKSIKTHQEYYEYLNSYKKIKIDKNSRINSTESCLSNMSDIQKNMNIKSFNSNMNGSSFEFFNSLGEEKTVFTTVSVYDKDLTNFLSIKYVIACNNEKLEDYNYELINKIDNYKIYYNKEYKEFGIIPNSYITNKEFKDLSVEDRKKTLSEKIILTSDQIKKYKDLYNENTKYEVKNISFDKNGFSLKVDSNKEALILFTVPYDEGFKAYINKKEVNIEKVSNGLMAIKINKGENNIEFNYFPKGLKIGIIFSCLSIIIFISYYIYNKRKLTLTSN